MRTDAPRVRTLELLPTIAAAAELLPTALPRLSTGKLLPTVAFLALLDYYCGC
jgi:hypothetical protein